MSYEVKEIMSPIIEFLLTCPFYEQFNIEVDGIDAQKFTQRDEDRMSLEYVGSEMTDEKLYIRGDVDVVRQANFQLRLKRNASRELYRKEVSEFIYNFEQWIDHCNYHDEVLRIGDDPQNEKMWADGGGYFMEWEDGRDANVYQIQLHIQFTKKPKIYEEESDVKWLM